MGSSGYKAEGAGRGGGTIISASRVPNGVAAGYANTSHYIERKKRSKIKKEKKREKRGGGGGGGGGREREKKEEKRRGKTEEEKKKKKSVPGESITLKALQWNGFRAEG